MEGIYFVYCTAAIVCFLFLVFCIMGMSAQISREEERRRQEEINGVEPETKGK